MAAGAASTNGTGHATQAVLWFGGLAACACALRVHTTREYTLCVRITQAVEYVMYPQMIEACF